MLCNRTVSSGMPEAPVAAFEGQTSDGGGQLQRTGGSIDVDGYDFAR